MQHEHHLNLPYVLRTYSKRSLKATIWNTPCCHTVPDGHCLFFPFFFGADVVAVGRLTNLIWKAAASCEGGQHALIRSWICFAASPVIHWLIISGLVPLNYGPDCKWTRWSSELEVTPHEVRHLLQIFLFFFATSGHRPRTLLQLVGGDTVRKFFPDPFTTIILSS